MKKIFTLALALMGLTTVANAATIDDVQVCKHSYVLCFDDWCGNGTAIQSAEKLYNDGKELYDAKRYEAAFPKLKAAAEKGHK